jgi:hypothetical protein
MGKAVGLVVGIVATLGVAWAAEPEPAAPADFKLAIDVYGLKKDPIERAELVVRKGIVYQFGSNDEDEVIIIDRGNRRVCLLHLARQVQTDVPMTRLDDAMARRRGEIAALIEKQEKAGGRANLVAAAMRRNLIEPKFAETFDAREGRLRMTNPNVEITATGEPEPDGARLSLIADTLTAIAKLSALRDPEIVPPFPRLEALSSLISAHHLRPTEVSTLYRLAGPPKKIRWTYRLVPSLTDEEVTALSNVEAMRHKAPFAPFEKYEAPPTEKSRSSSR